MGAKKEEARVNYEKPLDNSVEWITGERYAVYSGSNKKYINRIKSIYEAIPEKFKYFIENKDGSICAKFPLKWVKINPGGDMTKKDDIEEAQPMNEEEKAALVKRLKEGKKKKQDEEA